MCYSAQIVAEYKRYRALFGAVMSIKDYYDTFWRRRIEGKLKVPKAVEAEVLASDDPGLVATQALIGEFNGAEATRLEQEVFKQRTRLADAERKLQVKETKAATEGKRIATDKVAWALSKLADLRRTEPVDRDSRIFPGWFTPVMVMEEGRLVVKPMRYQCRPAGKPAFYDSKYPGTYNARRDNLEGFWKEQFGHSHGVMLASAFFENVNRHRVEGRELAPGEEVENHVLKFEPMPRQEMAVACLWSHWTDPNGEDTLYSCAAITDEPPSEVAAAGHDRCIIPIKPERVIDWLTPGLPLANYYEILDDRQRPYYEHRIAA